MHRLEQLIAEWRQTARTTIKIGDERQAELENHLREIAERFIRTGASEDDAFRSAVAQLGSATAISKEFQKLDSRVWLPVKITIGIGAACALLMAVLLRPPLDGTPHKVLLVSHIFTLTLGYLTSLLGGTLSICYVCQRCFSPFSFERSQSIAKASFRFSLIATGLTAAGLVLGCTWSKLRGRTFWSWEPMETAALLILAWLVCFSFIHQVRGITARTILTASIIGNMLVGAAWLGPFALAANRLHHANPNLAPIMIFMGLHLIFLFIGVAPALCLRPAQE